MQTNPKKKEETKIHKTSTLKLRRKYLPRLLLLLSKPQRHPFTKMLTKTTVLLSAIAAASATGLRSNSATTAAKFKEALRVTEVEQSFIEQT